MRTEAFLKSRRFTRCYIAQCRYPKGYLAFIRRSYVFLCYNMLNHWSTQLRCAFCCCVFHVKR